MLSFPQNSLTAQEEMPSFLQKYLAPAEPPQPPIWIQNEPLVLARLQAKTDLLYINEDTLSSLCHMSPQRQ